MIVSERYKYLFIEVPLTASFALREVLCEHYGGEPILHKHACYPEFQRDVGARANDYFVFATIRHPLDKVVSHYLKIKNDHKGAFSDPEATADLRVDYSDREKHVFLSESGASFAEFLRRYYRRPYSEMIELSRERLDYVIRYESLREGFAEVLHHMGVEDVQPIPVTNQTGGKRRWESYYEPELIPHTKRIFGPFMESWDYRFPAKWGGYEHSAVTALHFKVKRFVANRYLLYLRYNERGYAHAIRQLRALLVRGQASR